LRFDDIARADPNTEAFIGPPLDQSA